MLFALGAVSSALDALQSLTSQKSSATQQTGFGHGTANPFAFDSGSNTSSNSTDALSWVNSGNRPQISPETMSALLAAQSQSATGSTTSTSSPTSRQDALKDLFSQIDADGDGKITKSEFENALGAGGTNLAQADDVFSKLDANSDGSVSLDEMSKALKGAGHRHHHHAAGASGAGDGSDSSTQASGGSTSTSVTNADGSTTTTVKYADGFKVSMTTPGASSASSSANSPYNWFEQMMQREAQAISTSTASSAVSMTA
ncbi:EF-hand domain-containing protein [Bradyrhizobium sp.]|uniref:EF-hand domain-containing protein n=1 Tax=Bradyrhizobium sp. TaxID=376 RepID=UPI00239D21D2|nr:EF-hand domain-containing protein [Bradyrhizobium sp.]MDE2376843.1 EF-hand domain-containing protein [Bradyrhizobium sp.]